VRVSLFGNSEEKAAEQAAAKAEAERLVALPLAELAPEVLPAYGPDGAKPGDTINILQVMSWMMRDYPGGTKQLKELQGPVREAIGALEHADLLVEVGRRGAGSQLKLSRLGEQALAEGKVAEHLG
jgi:hypothetical protein